MNFDLRAILRTGISRTVGLVLLTAVGIGQSGCGDNGGSNGGAESGGAPGLGGAGLGGGGQVGGTGGVDPGTGGRGAGNGGSDPSTGGDPSSGGTTGGTGGTTGGTGGTAGGTGGTAGGTGGTAGGTGGTAGAEGGAGGAPTTSWKARVIHTTDIGADPDDKMSMVRAFALANDVDIEGLIATTGCWKKSRNDATMLDPLVNAYGEVVNNLQVHDPEYPSLEYIKSISVLGQTGYGMGDVGEGKDSEGSNLIIAAVDKDDPRPVWTTCWGGCNTIAQAVWKVQNTRSQADLDKFIDKLRVYDVLGQGTGGTWLAKTFPNLLYIRATQVYSWQPSDGWVDEHVQSHGPLGAAYPDRKWAFEGDSPAIFHVHGNGLHDPDDVSQNGWGGRFTLKSGVRGMSCMGGGDKQYDPYEMYNEAEESINRWKDALQNDFEARMDWSITSNYADANHHPVAVLNGDTGRSVLEMSGSGSVELSAAGTTDPDGDTLSYNWWIDEDPSTGTGSISSATTETTTVSVSSGSVHVVLEVVDTGSPNLTAYRRMIINAQ